MKVSPLIEARNGKLYSLSSGGEVPENALIPIELEWQKIECDNVHSSKVYDEAYLARLRESLQSEDYCDKYLMLLPLSRSRALQSESEKEAFVQAIFHAARRLKDCTRVVGCYIPKEFTRTEDKNAFVSQISSKHSHYIFL